MAPREETVPLAEGMRLAARTSRLMGKRDGNESISQTIKLLRQHAASLNNPVICRQTNVEIRVFPTRIVLVACPVAASATLSKHLDGE